MKKYLVGVLVFLSYTAQSQQILNEKFVQNLYATNPAFTGSTGGVSMTAILGNQFNGTVRPNRVSQVFMIENASSTKQFPNDSLKNIYKEKSKLRALEAERSDSEATEISSDEIPYTKFNKYSYGLIGYNGIGSAFTSTGLSGSFSYRIALRNNASLSAAVQAGFNYVPVYTGQIGNQDQFLPNFGIGATFQNEKSFIGLSFPLLYAKTDIVGIIPNKTIFMQAGYALESDFLSFYPFAQFSIINLSQLGGELNLKVWYKKRFAVGAGMSQSINGFNYLILGDYQLSKNTKLGFVLNPKPFGFSNVSGFRNSALINAMVKFSLKKDEQNIFSRF